MVKSQQPIGTKDNPTVHNEFSATWVNVKDQAWLFVKARWLKERKNHPQAHLSAYAPGQGAFVRTQWLEDYNDHFHKPTIPAP